MPLLFWCQRRVDLEHTFRERHANHFATHLYARKVCLSVRNLIFFFPFAHDQQRRFTGARPYIFDPADLTLAIEEHATDQIADVGQTPLKRGPLAARHLHFAVYESFGVGNRIDAAKLKNQPSLVWPEFFDFQLAPGIILRQLEYPHARPESVRDSSVQLDGNFALTSLRLDDTAEGNELVAYSRFS